MNIVWRDLNTDPPTGDEYAVLLFPCRTDCGLLYIVSNPQYAKGEFAKQRYTHWGSRLSLVEKFDSARDALDFLVKKYLTS